MKPTLEIARQYGVIDWHFGGCAEGSPIHKGQPGAMRRRGHAHHHPTDILFGHICFKAHSIERVPARLAWHEIAHIYRRSWPQEQCESWARKMARRREENG